MRLDVNNEGKFAYDILIEEDFSQLLGEIEKIEKENKKVCIVTDSNVSKLYLKEVSEILSARYQVSKFIFEAGEERKNLSTVIELYNNLLLQGFDRKDFLVALGGGVVGDLCGYVAATYLRGIDFIQIPTTLLSQVDSSIGGKTGVDLEGYKNVVGAFYMPRFVYINISTLLSLTENQYSSGMGEVIKHGLIKNKAYYEQIIKNKEKIKNRDIKTMKEIVLGSDLIKKEVVEADFKEEGLRATLNFGHTLGHAIEKYKNFELTHGACVCLGSLCALYISNKKAYISLEEIEEAKALFKYFSLPLSVSIDDEDKVLEYTKNDKKMELGQIKFILLQDIGQAYIDKSIQLEDMKEALRSIKSE